MWSVRKRKWVLLTVVLLGCAGLGARFLLRDFVGLHPDFGKIYQARASDLDVALADPLGRLLRRWLPSRVTRSVYFPARFKEQPRYLDFGDCQLEWSVGGAETGWLYFWNVGSRSGAAWEFAPSDKRRLAEVRLQSLPAGFFAGADPRLRTVFDKDSSTNAIKVSVGQVLFARNQAHPDRIYVLQFEKQEGMRILVDYCIAARK